MSNAIKRVLISVSNKNGILEFALNLNKLNIEIISTGGTYKYLKSNNINVIEASTITNFPEILDGRVKTLHPNIHGGILAQKDNPEHMEQLHKHNITPIDMVCVNLYPFEETINQPNCHFNEAIENIDIGGPAMIRASAKNHQHVVIVTNPQDYANIINELTQYQNIRPQTRLSLARKAFEHTAYYDGIITQYLKTREESNNVIFGETLSIPAKLVQNLRYGENSHQEAAFYKDSGNIDGLLASFTQLQGKELSYNNLADADTAWECVKQFTDIACVIVKHANPCGVAIGVDSVDSYQKAFAGDPISSFGGIIAFNCKVDRDTALAVSKQFMEVLIAPEFDMKALEVLAQKPNVRILEIKLTNKTNLLDYKRIGGGLLIQTTENKHLSTKDLTLVSKKEVTSSQLEDLLFAWSVARFVKSNAIVLVKNKQVIGIGAGQMSRIDSSKIAVDKATSFGFEVKGSACASDAFFPFRDNVDLLASNGITAIVHPGGSIKDKEVFAAADELGIAMLTTSVRAFRH